MKTDSAANSAEKKRMQDENELLRGIVLRQMKEQARRDQTRKLVLDQMSKMEVRSKELLHQIDYLGQPVVHLSAKERALFKKPQVEISDNEIAMAAPAPKSDDATASAPGPEAAQEENAPAASDPPLASAPAPPPPTAAAEPPPAPPAAAPTAARAATPPASSSRKLASKTEASATPPSRLAKSQPAATPAPEKKLTLSLDAPVSTALNLDKAPLTAMLESKSSARRDDGKAMDAGPKPGSLSEELPKPDQSSPPPPSSPSSSSAGSSDAHGGPAAVPKKFVAQVQEAKDQFERGNYRDAEKIYERISAEAPANLFILSNLGVVRFREGKLKMAEETFRRAIAVAPEDGFSHCTLGIVHYSQQKYDDAVNELTKALAVNPKNATAHNYLGITASQKGWQEAALKELESAIAYDPNYPDAYFNLAVVLATQQPPNKERARQCYKKALELGAEPDSSLEQLLK